MADTYEIIMESLQGFIDAQERQTESMAELLSPESGLFRESLEAQKLRAILRNWVSTQYEINKRVGQLITLVESQT